MSNVNVMRKGAGTILSNGINKYFLSFFVWFLWPQFGNLIVTLCIHTGRERGGVIYGGGAQTVQIPQKPDIMAAILSRV
jgi:hypothetical protein